MKRLTLLSLAWLVTACGSTGGDGMAALKRFVGEDVTIEGGRAVAYCPDNTCELFRSAQNDALADTVAFAHLYLYFFSDYQFLAQARAADGVRTDVSAILRRYQSGCSAQTEREVARCVLSALAQRSRIEAYSVRYDEQRRIEEPLDLSIVLRPSP